MPAASLPAASHCGWCTRRGSHAGAVWLAGGRVGGGRRRRRSGRAGTRGGRLRGGRARAQRAAVPVVREYSQERKSKRWGDGLAAPAAGTRPPARLRDAARGGRWNAVGPTRPRQCGRVGWVPAGFRGYTHRTTAAGLPGVKPQHALPHGPPLRTPARSHACAGLRRKARATVQARGRSSRSGGCRRRACSTRSRCSATRRRTSPSCARRARPRRPRWRSSARSSTSATRARSTGAPRRRCARIDHAMRDAHAH